MKVSRAERYRAQRRVDRDAIRYWVLGLLFSCSVLFFEFAIEIPADAEWLLEMELALFSASFTLLAFYLLGLTFVFSRQEAAGKVNHQVIIYVWLGAILYHLFLLITGIANGHAYKAGILLFLGPLFLTVFHFITYLSAMLEARREAERATAASLEKNAFQLILESTRVYDEIKRLQQTHGEVSQMLTANGFDLRIERTILEVQQHLHAERFGPKEVEFLEGRYYYLENVLTLVKQLPDVKESRTFAHRKELEP